MSSAKPLGPEATAATVVATTALVDGPACVALRDAMSVLDLAAQRPHPITMCEALTDVARHLAGQHAYPAAEAYLGQALDWAGRLPQAVDIRGDLMCALAEIACNQADLIEAQADDSRSARSVQREARERARDWAWRAADASRGASDPQWEVSLLLRASDVLSRGGDHDDASAMQTHAQALLEIAEARRQHAPVPGAMQLPAPQALM